VAIPDGHEPGSRIEAVHDLERIEEQGAFAGLGRRRGRRRSADEGKITDLVFGVTRWRRYLDFLIDRFYTGSPDKLELRIRVILRIGLYELLLTREPDHAAVNEAVEAARRTVGKRATGLVNGILRSVQRSRDDLPEPDAATEAERLGIRFSHPTWMVERWLGRYGEATTVRLLASNNERPRFGLRVRDGDRPGVLETLREHGADASASPWLDDYVRVETIQPVYASGVLSDGRVLVQDEGAGAVVRALDVEPGERVLDVCAAPGGKSFYLADLVGPAGHVCAIDRSASRLRLLEREANRLGLEQIETHSADFTTLELSDLGLPFDRVLVDAPCSGLGVLAKRADLRWRVTPERQKGLQEIQRTLLHHAAGFVRPGGVLVYGTCTIEPEEDEEIASWFSGSHGDFVCTSVRNVLAGAIVSEGGFLRSLPHEHGIDGAFAARWIRR
jgi:16S rRNA (cytosine967-C5)-methyltransferase